jgi:hypothetical protein
MNFYEEYKKLDALSKARLRKELENAGGIYNFGEDTPIVSAHPFGFSSDYVILSAFINTDDDVCLVAREVGGYEEITMSSNDIEGSHIPYIWDYID